MDLLAHLRRLARYNAWANDRLYAACAEAGIGTCKQSSGASFGSIHGTLNHLLLTDRLWLLRFRREPIPPMKLTDELYTDFGELRQASASTSQGLIEYLDFLAPSQLDQPVTFTSISRGTESTYPLGDLLLHVFNHQTYHRGQVALMLRQASIKPPETDLLWFNASI